jgi:hypothetical protein
LWDVFQNSFIFENHSAVSRMISRNGVCGLNFTQRSSFSTSGLRQVLSSRQGQPRIARSFNCGKRHPTNQAPEGRQTKPLPALRPRRQLDNFADHSSFSPMVCGDLISSRRDN